MNGENAKPARLTSSSICVIIFCALFAGYFSLCGARQHTNINTSRFDLGNMSQVVWNTAHGRIFEFTDPYGTQTISRFAYHADPILIAFAPLYWVWADPRMLIIVQAVIVAFGGWMLFLLAKRILSSNWLAAGIAIAFLMYPTLQHAVLFDFHPLTIAATFGLIMLYAMYAKRWRLFVVSAILFMLCKEELGLIVATLGVWQWIASRSWKSRWGIVAAAALAYVAIMVFVIMPIAGKSVATGLGNIHQTQDRQTPREIISQAISHPSQMITNISQPQTKKLVLGLLVPVSGLALANPAPLLAAWPELLIPLVDTQPATRALIFHYHAITAIFIFLSAILGIRAAKKRMAQAYPKMPERYTDRSLLAVLFLGVMVGYYFFSPLPFSRMQNLHGLVSPTPAPFIRQSMMSIPKNASISATNSLGAQVAEREHIYYFPEGIDQADYVAILLAEKGSIEWRGNHVQAEALAQNPAFELMVHKDNFSIYRRR